MNFNDHSKLRGLHAKFSASNYHWINYDYEKLVERYNKSYSQQIGTVLHSFCEDRIETGIKLNRHDKNSLKFELARNYIPISAIESIDMDIMFETIYSYVNDAIINRLTPEQILYYSEHFFGTADAIGYDERKHKLIIFDLKTGENPAHLEQLFIYVALFCLEYGYKPMELDTEVRIYQHANANIYNPDASDIVPIMDTIVMFNKYLEKLED